VPEIDADADALVACVLDRLHFAHAHRDAQAGIRVGTRFGAACTLPAGLSQHLLDNLAELFPA